MTFVDPTENILQMGLKEGMKVADLGAGSGHYAISASRIVGESGRVYAVDVQEDMLVRLKNDATRIGCKNIETIWGNIERAGGTKLKDHSVDAVILSNTLFQLAHKKEALEEIRRIVKPGGIVLVTDWAGDFQGIGPAPAQVVSEQITEELFIGGGFYKVKSYPTGLHHYSIVFTAP